MPLSPNSDSSGNLIWNTFFGSGSDDEGNNIAVDGNGNVFVTGGSSGTWGSPLHAFAGGIGDAFVAKLDSSGALIWNTFLGGSDADGGIGLAVDGVGNTYVSGISRATWGNPVRAYATATSDNNYDAFAAKLSSSGALAACRRVVTLRQAGL